MTKKIVKKAAAKKAIPAKKTAVKKTPAKKSLNVSETKKVATKKVVVPKKVAVKKSTAPKKVATKKAAPKKVAVKSAQNKAIAQLEKYVKVLKEKGEKKTSSIKKAKTLDNAELVLQNAILGMQEKKAKNIICIKVKGLEHAVCDYMLICEAESTTQVDAIANSVWEEVRKNMNEKPYHIEGKDNAQWILLDYVNVVVHVFQTESRLYYNIEKLWADGEFKNYED